MRVIPTALKAFAACAVLALASCQPAPRGDGEPAIWRITDADSEIWLFGTVHILPANLDWRGPRFDAAFNAADEVVTETNIDEAADTYLALTARYGVLPAGQLLSDRIGAEQWQRLQRVARAMELEANLFENSRPWFAAVRLSVIYAARNGHMAEYGVESVIVPEARAAGKQLSHLETAEQQIQALAGLPREDELRFLSITLRQIENEGASLEETDRLWVEGDVAQLGRMLENDLREAGPAVYDAVIVRRNQAWADAIQERLAGSGRTLYAVGAAHLMGDDSVVALLRARGIEVEGP